MAFLDESGLEALWDDVVEFVAKEAVPPMSSDVRGGAKLDEHGGLVLRDEKLGIGSLVQESDGTVRGSIAELTAKGHAEQDGTPTPESPVEIQVVRGKNLLDESQYEHYGIYSSDGHLTASANENCIFAEIEQGETYRVTMTSRGTSTYLYYGFFSDRPQNGSVALEYGGSVASPITAPSGAKYVGLFFGQGKSVEPQLTLGSTPQPYVPYGHVGMKVQGKNLLPNAETSKTVNGITFTVNADGSVTCNGTATSNADLVLVGTGMLSISADTQYVLSGAPGYSGCSLRVSDNKTQAYADTGQGAVFSYADTSEAHVYIRISSGTVISTPITFYPQLELGSTATEYEPYHHTTTPIPLPQRGWVAGLPDGTADSLRLDGAGKCEWTLPTEIQVFDGSSDEGWAGYGTGTSGKYRMNSVLIQSVARKTPTGTVAPIVCDMFAAKTLSNVYSCIQGISLDGSEAVISLYADSYQDASSWRTYLASNNMTLLYPLATPVTEDCGYVDLPDIPSNATVSIPELDALGVKYFVDNSAGTLAQQWYERANDESDASMDQKIELVESNIATIESTTAKSNHAVNSYFMLDNVLRKATSAIASGETISNSNSSPITVEQVMTTLNNSVAALEKEVVFAITPSVSHRNIYRGKNLGTALTTAQKAQIAAGTFDDLYVGDYWTINGRVYRIADINYYYNSGDTAFTKNHLVIVPDASFGSDKMNDTNITTGAYKGSKMCTDVSSVLNTARTTIANDFGSALATHRIYLQNAVTNGYASAGEWTDSTVDLMNEPMVYGSYIHTPAGNGSIVLNRSTVEKSQLALFRLNHRMINPGRYWYWLRDVVSAAYFASASAYGVATCYGASSSGGVRPDFCIVGD